MVKVMECWNRLFSEVVNALPLETFKVSLHEALSSLIWLEMSLLIAEGFRLSDL